MIAKLILTLLIILEAGYMGLDGIHGLRNGDYIGPKNAQGRTILGPWSKAVSAVGIKPRSRLMMSMFVTYSAVWLAVLLLYWLGVHTAVYGLAIMALGTLWYLPIGTIDSLLQLMMLWLRHSS
ncbi:MAG TPA: hypothetical protein VGS08_04215 [Candidatus Saccharimonadales bacterium]|nr:hypothetical protein [Candidatus Saccharimonadales bacterium]